MLNGCDLSDNQGDIDFAALSTAIDFAMVRASQGISIVDKRGVEYRDALRKAGVPIGHYHFAMPLESTGPEQAVVFLAAVGEILPGEPLALDVERDFDDLAGWAAEFVRIIIAETGVPPLLYTNQDFLHRYGFSELVGLGCGLWLSTDSGDPNTVVPVSPFPFYALHQWTFTGELPGVTGDVDRDSFFGDVEHFRLYGKPNTAEPVAAQEGGGDVQVTMDSTPATAIAALTEISLAQFPV